MLIKRYVSAYGKICLISSIFLLGVLFYGLPNANPISHQAVQEYITFVPASQLKVNTKLKTSSNKTLTVVAVHKKTGEHDMYNLTVSQNHNYFIGTAWKDGVLVHNMCPTEGGSSTTTSAPSPDMGPSIAGGFFNWTGSLTMGGSRLVSWVPGLRNFRALTEEEHFILGVMRRPQSALFGRAQSALETIYSAAFMGAAAEDSIPVGLGETFGATSVGLDLNFGVSDCAGLAGCGLRFSEFASNWRARSAISAFEEASPDLVRSARIAYRIQRVQNDISALNGLMETEEFADFRAAIGSTPMPGRVNLPPAVGYSVTDETTGMKADAVLTRRF